jgi:hypothetical protein
MKSSKKPGATDKEQQTAHDRYVRCKLEVESKLIDAFFADKLSKKGRQQVIGLLAEDSQAPVAAVQEELRRLTEGEFATEHDPERLARFREELSAMLEERSPQKKTKPKKVRPRPQKKIRPRRLYTQPIGGYARPSITFLASLSPDRAKSLSRYTAVLLLNPDPVQRLAEKDRLGHRFRKLYEAANLADALSIIAGLSTKTVLVVVARELSRQDRAQLRSAMPTSKASIQKRQDTDPITVLR